MPIDLYSSIDKTSQWAFGSPLLNNVLSSSLFVAIAIALLMCLLIMVMYPAKSGTPFSIVIKMFVYMMFGSLLIIFLHDGVLKYMFKEELDANEADDFMNNVNQEGRVSDPTYSISHRQINPQNAPPVAPPVAQPVVTGSGAHEAESIVENSSADRLANIRPPVKAGNPFQ